MIQSYQKKRPYEEICDLLRGHFTPTVLLFRKRIEFYNLKQKEEETIGMWFATLKSASIDCKFGIRLNDVIKDKFVAGLRPGRVLDRLCEEVPEEKTLKNIVELALKYETTTKNATTEFHKLNVQGWKGKQSKGLQFDSKKAGRNQKGSSIKERSNTYNEAACYVCGKTNHKFAIVSTKNIFVNYVM